MNKHDSEDELLDQLYSKSAKEQPPSRLDKKILAEAKARYQPGTLAASFKWQRILSVAAVMVLSIYVFFDVNDNRMPSINSELYYQQERTPNASSYTSDEHDLRRKMKSKEAKKVQQKASRKSAEIEANKFMADEMLEQSAELDVKPESAIQGQSEISMEASKTFSAPEPQQQKRDLSTNHELAASIEEHSELYDADLDSKETVSSEAARKQKQRIDSSVSELASVPNALPENASHEAEKMIKEIQQLLANGDLEAAKILYDKFKLSFPERTVPTLIEHSLQK